MADNRKALQALSQQLGRAEAALTVAQNELSSRQNTLTKLEEQLETAEGADAKRLQGTISDAKNQIKQKEQAVATAQTKVNNITKQMEQLS